MKKKFSLPPQIPILMSDMGIFMCPFPFVDIGRPIVVSALSFEFSRVNIWSVSSCIPMHLSIVGRRDSVIDTVCSSTAQNTNNSNLQRTRKEIFKYTKSYSDY